MQAPRFWRTRTERYNISMEPIRAFNVYTTVAHRALNSIKQNETDNFLKACYELLNSMSVLHQIKTSDISSRLLPNYIEEFSQLESDIRSLNHVQRGNMLLLSRSMDISDYSKTLLLDTEI